MGGAVHASCVCTCAWACAWGQLCVSGQLKLNIQWHSKD